MVDHGNNLGVIHTGGADDTDGTDDPSAALYRFQNQRGVIHNLHQIFVADVDLHLALVLALLQSLRFPGDQLNEIVLLLDHGQNLFQPAYVVILGIGQQAVDTLHLQFAAVKGRQRFVHAFGNRIDQVGVHAHLSFHLHQQRQRNVLRAHVDHRLVQDGCQPLRRVGGDRRFRQDVLALDHAAGHHHNQNQLPIRHADHLKLIDRIPRTAGAECQRGVIRHRRSQAHSLLQDIIQFRLAGTECGFQLRHLAGGHIIILNKGIHVEAVARLRRNTAGGSMGLFQISHLLQLRHLIADRSRGVGDLLILHQIFASHRLAGFDVSLDNCLQYQFLSLAQFADHFRSSPSLQRNAVSLSF